MRSFHDTIGDLPSSASSSRSHSPLSESPREEGELRPELTQRRHDSIAIPVDSRPGMDATQRRDSSPGSHEKPSRPTSWTDRARGAKADVSATAVLIVLYFGLNLGLTFYNKSLLINFPYPYLITAIHSGSCVVGCAAIGLINRQSGHTRGKEQDPAREGHPEEQNALLKADRRDSQRSSSDAEDTPAAPAQSLRARFVKDTTILAYSTLYAANIAVSNASLGLVSVPFHQILRSTCPLFTAALSFALLAKRPARGTLVALVPVVCGAGLSCLGEMSFTSTGFLLTLLGTLLAAVKTVTTNLLQGGAMRKKDAQPAPYDAEKGDVQRDDTQRAVASALSYSPLELLAVMSPLACVQCLAVSCWTGELRRAMTHLTVESATDATMRNINVSLLMILAGNGAVAFALNFFSFKTNRAAGPLAMTVVGNLKQVTTIVLAVWLYGMSLGMLNVAGIVMALCGASWYGIEAYKAKRRAA